MNFSCNDCKNYDAIEGICKLTGENHYGCEGACNKFERERDTAPEELERWEK